MIPPEMQGKEPQSCPRGTVAAPKVAGPWKPTTPRCHLPRSGSCGSCRTAYSDAQGTIRRWAECRWRWVPWDRDKPSGGRPSSSPHANSISNADSGFDEPSPAQNREWCYYNAHTKKPGRAYRGSANNLSSWEINSNKQVGKQETGASNRIPKKGPIATCKKPGPCDESVAERLDGRNFAGERLPIQIGVDCTHLLFPCLNLTMG